MLDKVIATALKLWLHSQVETVEDLQVNIVGGERQILKGYLPSLCLASSRGIYQGLHLRHIVLEASKIRFNLAEVLKGKSLKLLEPIPVITEISLTAEDLQASLGSPLLSSGLTDFCKNLIFSSNDSSDARELKKIDINWQTICFAEPTLILRGTLFSENALTTQIEILTGLQLANSHTLLLSPLTITTNPKLSIDWYDRWEIDLGDLVSIDELSITSEGLLCSGELKVIP
jgi:hypothetical protein